MKEVVPHGNVFQDEFIVVLVTFAFVHEIEDLFARKENAIY